MDDPRTAASHPPPGTSPVEPAIDLGIAGASARHEHARRTASRKGRQRERYGTVIAAVLDLKEPAQHEKAWARGAAGEERLAASLAKRCSDAVIVLHDRRLSKRSRANVDHIAICPSGVWVIDAKRYKGPVRVQRPLLGKPKLTVAGRDQSKLLSGLGPQLEAVTEALADLPSPVPVHGALCFVDGDLPILGLGKVGGITLTAPRALAKQLNRPGALSAETVRELAGLLSERMPAAVAKAA